MKNSFPGGRANRETRGVKNSVQITEKALLQLRAKRSFSGGSPPREWTLKWNPETKHLAGQLLKCCSVNAHNNLKRQFSQVVPYPWDTVRPVCVYRSDCVTQSCLTLCDPMDCSPPGSSVHGILPARILQWVAIPFCRRSSWSRDWTWVSCIAGRFFTIWATREALVRPMFISKVCVCRGCFYSKMDMKGRWQRSIPHAPHYGFWAPHACPSHQPPGKARGSLGKLMLSHHPGFLSNAPCSVTSLLKLTVPS